MAESKLQKLEKKITHKKESAWLGLKASDKKRVETFSKNYKEFLFHSKTERTATKTIVATLKKKGFKDACTLSSFKTGDKIYLTQKNKSVIAAVIGKTQDRFHMVGSHIDSPRLDIKPNPLYENQGFALLQTHYYGGVKKYQWVNIDLALYGVIHTKKGKKIDFQIGEKEDEPRFIMSDLLPHLGRDQLDKKGSKVIEGEQLNIFVGHEPINDKDIKDKVKFQVLKYLHETYDLVEDDFAYAELQFVPAGKPTDIGFDKALIAGYGHDDKCCSYANLIALLDAKPKTTAVAYFSDKEEIGSYGNTGAQSFLLWDFAELLVQKCNLSITAKHLLSHSKALSADVTAGVNPNFVEVHEMQNAAKMGHGISIEKYTGGGGKYSANDTHAEYMNEIRMLLQKHKINHHVGELGKIDLGGGGTIALYLSRFGIETVDAGPPVLGMHSPREILSKIDLYESYRLYKVFFDQ